MDYDIKDINLAPQGRLRAEWAEREMPVLRSILERFKKERTLANTRVAACLHVTAETANLVKTLVAGGAEVRLAASNPLSTQDDISAHLVDIGVPVFAITGESRDTYFRHLNAVVDFNPTITIDDGADLVALVHSERGDVLPGIKGGMEETTTGVIRLRALSKEGRLRYPIIAVNDSDTKHLFDNRYGTGQSTLDGILRATNLLIAGKQVAVIGYGMCGRGVATRAKGMGARVIVCEVNPVNALEAVMDGHTVMPIEQAVAQANIVITVTGNKHVLDKQHFESMRDGAVIANAGHFNFEINIDALDNMSKSKRTVRNFVKQYNLKGGRKIFLLADGRLINLAAAEGHPPSVMDLSFANQALGCEYIQTKGAELKSEVHVLPKQVDRQIAMLKLTAMGIGIDTLTKNQEKYLASWEAGT